VDVLVACIHQPACRSVSAVVVMVVDGIYLGDWTTMGGHLTAREPRVDVLVVCGMHAADSVLCCADKTLWC
jgi:hypothetical protein